MKRISEEDLQHILRNTESLWSSVKNKSFFLTGGTGFFGKWLLESFLFINKKLELNAQMVVLSRNPEKFLADFPFYKNESSIRFLKGDILNFETPPFSFQYIIHAATDSDAALNLSQPLVLLDNVIEGTKRILEFAQQNPVESFLYTSSGAVYGQQPPEVTHIKESDSFKVDINKPASVYAEGKRVAELYGSIYNVYNKIPVKIARCFAFVGPYLPLNKHFAIGNFIGNALNKEDIIIKGDGAPCRSYLYAADLVIWLWTILFNGKENVPYNVGSDIDLSLRELADLVKQMQPGIEVQVLTELDKSKPTERYIPNIDLAKQTLGLDVRINLKEAIEKTFKFYEN
jgi:nucleoside-diphosphate-sugar epimerase